MSWLKKRIILALVVAIPLELVNFFFLAFPIDVGLPDDAPWYAQALGAEWVLLHLPGLRLTSWLDPYPSSPNIEAIVWMLSGYIDTALVLIAGILIYWAVRCFVTKHFVKPG
jgi:hypothetical protein